MSTQSVEIESIFLSVPPDYSGWSSPALGELRSAGLYRGGVDIVFHAAGESGWGVAAAARKVSQELGRHLWMIGVDYDEYRFAELEERPHILTSALLPWEDAAYMAVTDFARGRFEPGIHLLELGSRRCGLFDQRRLYRRPGPRVGKAQSGDHQRRDPSLLARR